MPHSYVICHKTALAQMNISNDSAISPGFVCAWDTLLLHEIVMMSRRKLDQAKEQLPKLGVLFN